MATIANPTKKYNVNNCPIAHIESATSGHSQAYEENTGDFLIELIDDTRTEQEAESLNNPVEFTITGEIVR